MKAQTKIINKSYSENASTASRSSRSFSLAAGADTRTTSCDSAPRSPAPLPLEQAARMGGACSLSSARSFVCSVEAAEEDECDEFAKFVTASKEPFSNN